MINTFLGASLITIFILIITYFVLGLKILISNMMLLGMYAFIVPCLYFTFGSYIEKLIVEKQINNLIDQVLNETNQFGVALPNININVSYAEDDIVEQKNKKLIEESFITTTVFSFIFILFTYFLYKVIKNNYNYSHIVFENLIILLFIIIVELLFFGFIVRNYRTLDSNVVSAIILNDIGEKMLL